MTEYTVVITDEKDITINGTPAKNFVILNKPYPNLTVYKVSDLDMPLAGGEFQLVSSENSYTATSDAEGNAVFQRVMPGNYELSETKAPTKYRRSADKPNVIVTVDGVLTIDGVESNTVTMKNKELMDLGVTVMFSDMEDKYKHRPDTVEMYLYQNGTLFETYEVHTGLSTYVLIHLLEKYDDDGNLYVYTVDQETVPYYRTEVDGYTIMNILESFDLKGTKTWDDDNDADNKRPSSITVRLLQNGTEIKQKTVTEADNWEYTFSELPLAAIYVILEDPVASYNTTYDDWNIINKIKDIN